MRTNTVVKFTTLSINCMKPKTISSSAYQPLVFSLEKKPSGGKSEKLYINLYILFISVSQKFATVCKRLVPP